MISFNQFINFIVVVSISELCLSSVKPALSKPVHVDLASKYTPLESMFVFQVDLMNTLLEFAWSHCISMGYLRVLWLPL